VVVLAPLVPTFLSVFVTVLAIVTALLVPVLTVIVPLFTALLPVSTMIRHQPGRPSVLGGKGGCRHQETQRREHQASRHRAALGCRRQLRLHVLPPFKGRSANRFHSWKWILLPPSRARPQTPASSVCASGFGRAVRHDPGGTLRRT
jgi:hypothetical protein